MFPLHERLTWLLAALGTALGAYARRLATPPQPVMLGLSVYVPRQAAPALPPLAPALVQLFWNRLARTIRRFATLHAAWQQGTLKPPRTRTPSETRRTSRPPALRLPTGHAWLHRHAPEIAPAAGMLDAFVQDQELRRFATEEPRIGRLLRPICRAFGVVPPPELRLPPRPRAPRKPRPRRERPLPLTHPDLKLQPYVIRAVRYIRKKYGRD